MTDSSREGGYPPNNVIEKRRGRTFNARIFAEDLMVVLVVALEAKDREASFRLLLAGVRQLCQTHKLFKVNSHG